MAIANALNAQTAGIQGMSSTGVWTGTAMTQNAILAGGATASTITNVTPAANSILVTDGSNVPSLGTSLSNDFTFTKATSGATTTLTVSNTSNTASSAANILAQVAGGTAADATHQSTISGGQAWTWGLDNSDSDAFVIASSSTLGTTNVMRVATTGEINYPLQSAFLANLDSAALNKTGNGATYTLGTDALTEIFDQGGDFNTNGTFTAPVTGKYHLSASIILSGCTVNANTVVTLVTSNRSYAVANGHGATAQDNGCSISHLCDMDAADTCTVTVLAVGEAGNTDDVAAGAKFSGYLAC